MSLTVVVEVVTQESIQEQYRLLQDIFVLLDDGDRNDLAEFGITTSQFRVLMLLNTVQGIRLATLADRLLLARSTITRIVDQLEQDRLTKRLDDPADRRAQHVVLTELGAQLRQQAQVAHLRSLERRLSTLAPGEMNTLNDLLRKLRHSLGQDLSARTGR
ncbi:MAG: MarR family transcriptional regulator [Anaerolineae bacterium]|nr:MarR family transcriptional regulator [Anaerolineae bacterium]